MNLKRLTRFYFSAEELNGTMDKLIINLACRSWQGEGATEYYVERIQTLTNAKAQLSQLYKKLDAVFKGLKEEDIVTLKFYAFLRTGVRTLSAERYREVHRATVKFSRRIKGRIEPDEEGYVALARYAALL